jgi:hypothetical protein
MDSLACAEGAARFAIQSVCGIHTMADSADLGLGGVSLPTAALHNLVGLA